MKIAVVAGGSPIAADVAQLVFQVARERYQDADIWFHPQCFSSAGHFAGDDIARQSAFLQVANDATFDAVWFARGGYGSNRIALDALREAKPSARNKTYLGYSDAGFLQAAMYRAGFQRVAHGPMPFDVLKDNGTVAIDRALRFLLTCSTDTLEPSVARGTKAAAFNVTVLSNLLGTDLEPDLSGHVLMLEEVSEEVGAFDRMMFQITSNAAIRRVSGLRLGRCVTRSVSKSKFDELVIEQPDERTEEEIVEHWCRTTGIRYLGRADIGHDIMNKIVPFGDPAWVFANRID